MENNLVFIAEQDGEIERELKLALTEVFLHYDANLRAYLVLTSTTAHPNEMNVMLCLYSDKGEDINLVNQCAQQFKILFANNQHLDIMFLSTEKECLLRSMCCPFFTSANSNVNTPDFYLYSTEGYHLDDTIRKCFMRKRLYGEHKGAYILCDISPPIIGQQFGLGERDIHQIMVALRYDGSVLVPISDWPLDIYVMHILTDVTMKQIISKFDYEVLGLAEIYQQVADVNLN